MPSSIVRFRPAGPWRFGPDTGARDRVDLIYHSDSLYAAVTSAMLRLGLGEEWLDATVRRQDGEPEVRFSSMFPFQRDVLFVTPPCNMWPPPPSTKIRFKSARFVPVSIVKALVADQNIDENRWIIDGESQCMISSGEGPFRIGLRSGAAVDRITGVGSDAQATACLEFGRDAGLWAMVVFSGAEAQDRWKPRVVSALRLLADSGFGGERSRGWGRCSDPQWNGSRDLLNWSPGPESTTAYWMLSLYAPSEADGIDWKTGNYNTVLRTGRTESTAKWGALKRSTLMIGEGSVLMSPQAPKGEARDVAPEEVGHPVYRAGFAVAIPVPWRAPKPLVVETPVTKPVRETVPAEVPEAVAEIPALASQTEQLAPEPEPEHLTAESEPQTLAPESEPQHLTAEPEPEHLTAEPELEHLTAEPEPQHLTAEPEPQHLTAEPELQHLTSEPEPQHLTAEPEPQHLTAEPEPQTLAPEPEPEHLTAEPEPQPLAPQREPDQLTPGPPDEPHKPEPESSGGGQ